LSYELELIALAAMFYLYDSSVLIFSNEAILTSAGAERWSAIAGGTGFSLAGRTLCILNPLTPYRPSFRLHWDFETLELGRADPLWSNRAQEFKTFAPLSVIAGVALFLLLPLGMFSDLGRYAVIPALFLLYGAIVLALIRLYRKRVSLSMSGRRFWGFAFECVACPPFGINMVRHLTLADRVGEPAPLAAARLLDPARWGQFRDLCVARLDAAIDTAIEDPREQAALQAQKLRMSTLGPPA
jgi:hypothetical protein